MASDSAILNEEGLSVMGMWGKSVVKLVGVVSAGSIATLSAGQTVSPPSNSSASKAVRVVAGTVVYPEPSRRLPVPEEALGLLFNAEDYPPEAIRAGEAGAVVFELDIDRNGEPSDCSIVRSSGSGALDRKTCDILLARAHFTPARGTDGAAIGGRYSARVNWILPKPSSHDVETRITFTRAGDAVVCHASVAGKPAEDWTSDTCRQLIASILSRTSALPPYVDMHLLPVNPGSTSQGK